MKPRLLPSLTKCIFAALLLSPHVESRATTILQAQDGSQVAFEAESYNKTLPGIPESWEIKSDSAASGSSVLYANGDNNTANAPHGFALYQIKFSKPGTYNLYYRWKADPARTAGDVFTANSSFIGKDFGTYTTPAIVDPFFRTTSNDLSAPSDNTFSWKKEIADTAAVYTVTQAQVDAGVPLILTVGTREAGMAFDRFVLSADSNLTDAQLDAFANSETDIVVQGANDAYLAFEAETKASLIPGVPESWQVQSDSTASGSSVLYATGDNNTANAPHGFALYQIRFSKPGTYNLYYRWKADPARTAGDVFTANSSFIGKDFGTYTTPAIADPFFRTTSNDLSAPSDNTFSWKKEIADTAAVYTVSQAQVDAGVPLILTVGTREAGMVFDRFVLSMDANLTDAQLDALANSGARPVAPELVKASGSSALNTVAISFTRPLKASSIAVNKFTINGLTVSAATLDANDARKVNLTTSAQTQGTIYTVSVKDVTDENGTSIAPNAAINFTAWKITPGWVTREIYFNVTGSTVQDLMNDANFQAGKPSKVEYIKAFSLNNDPLTDNYGAVLSAFFSPASAGVYEFFISNDDEAELLLSTDQSEANLQSLGIFPLTAAFDPSVAGTSPDSLATGKSYLLRGVLKQGTGDARLEIAARKQGATTPVEQLSSLSGNQISTWVNPDAGKVTFKKQPTNVSAASNGRAQFSVDVSTDQSPIYYQWRANGVDIPGAIRPVYTTPILTSGDSGKKYSVVISVAGNDTASSEATLTVTAGESSNLQPFIGINFVGGGGGGLGGTLLGVDVAGAVQQENWNNLAGFTADQASLTDVKGADTPVTLSYQGTESWYSGTIQVGDANGVLLQGYVNTINAADPMIFTLAGIPAGKYSLLAYSVGFQFQATYEEAFSITGSETYPTLHVQGQTGLDYSQNPGLKRMSSTDPNKRDLGNYVQFDNISPATDGTIVLSVTPESQNTGNNHLPAVNAIQLVRFSEPVISASPILTVNRNANTLTIAWPAGASGFVLETSPALGAVAKWTAVAGTQSPIQGSGQTTVSLSTGTGFYRLRK